MKNTMTLSILTFIQAALILMVLSLAPVSSALADSFGTSGTAWVDRIETAISQDQAVVRRLDLETNIVPSDVRVRLAAIADDQAQIWGDTILEGDFYAEDEILLDGVEAVLIDGAFVGYRITYSSVAFDTGAFGGCLPGRILESTFVSPELDSWTRDTNAYAHFVPDEV